MRIVLVITLLFVLCANLFSLPKDSTVVQEVHCWRLGQDGLQIDSVAVDTAFYRINNYDRVYKKYPHSFLLSNKGSAYRSNSLVDQGYANDFLFITNLDLYFKNPYSIEFYNTRTPYTNLQYYYGPPKRRSEETVSALHTQNITKRWNAGFDYNLSSSLGRYDASKSDYRNFRLFTSYQGENYTLHAAAFYNKSFNYENGGLVDDSIVIKHQNTNLQPENIPVYLRTSQTQIENYRAYFAQTLGIGSVGYNEKDSLNIPIATVGYTLDLNTYDRLYMVDDDELKNEFYHKFNIDSLSTRDSIRYSAINNIFQLKINEEANPYLKFGLRAYLGNCIETFKQSAAPEIKDFGEDIQLAYYQHQTETLISSFLGGQIFKNRGENFWWNAGAKLYFQGYKAGEFRLDGALDSRFPLWGKGVAGLFANGSLEFKAPNYFHEKFYSNHFDWTNNFNFQKIIRLNGGVKIPSADLSLTGHINYFYDYIYWDVNAIPLQYSSVLQTYGVTVHHHFKLWRFNSINDGIFQITTNDDVMPLPLFSIYSSNYLEFTYSKVLVIQFGVDIKYHTAYYSPAYMPATGMFIAQNERKTGNFPNFAPFINAHIKRFNFFLEYDHINQGYPSYDNFHTIGYPYNPSSLKLGVMWNFYN